ncbi:TPA: DinI-like family protein [Klebsiella pneumoniae]|nr:DinI-like family protein [Klebsiella pneumoniae]HEL6477007.1 DinI-like family protein [Klebsiella pneumoniae]HEL7757977.1 DinI-like family protein [Klebsiella pneumoniae]
MDIVVNVQKSLVEEVAPDKVEVYIAELKNRLALFYPSAEITVTAEERRNYIKVNDPVNITDEQTVSTITDEIFNSGEWRYL